LINAGLVVCVALAGCARDDAAATTDPSASVNGEGETPAEPVESTAEVVSDADAAPHAQPPAASAPADLRSELPAAEESQPSSEDGAVDDNEMRNPPGERERVLILTPGGPLVVDAWIMIDGRPHTEQFAARIERVLDAADTDGDGRATWAEWAANGEFLRGDLSNIDPKNKRLIDMWIERFDENRDKQLQSNEAAAWLGRDAVGSIRPLALRSRRSYLPIPTRNSRVWELLDVNRNGRLADDEIAAARDRLWSLDADDDRIITVAEMASLRDLLDAAGPSMAPAFEDNRYAAIQLEPTSDLARLQYLLSDLYAPRQNLGPTSFPELPDLFDKLDANSDDWLETAELGELLAIEPHLALSVTFTNVGSLDLPPAIVRVESHAPEFVVATATASNRILVAIGNTRLIVSAHDLAASQGVGGDALRNDLRLMVHDQCDALFEELDANADGRLGEREISTCSQRLAAQDASGDGAIVGSELPNFMVVAYLRGETPSEQSFYTPAIAATRPPNGPAPPWFARADFNGDGDVSRREFLGSAEQFSRLDSNQDDFVSATEAAAFGD
jgi:hypothetical protein